MCIRPFPAAPHLGMTCWIEMMERILGMQLSGTKPSSDVG